MSMKLPNDSFDYTSLDRRMRLLEIQMNIKDEQNKDTIILMVWFISCVLASIGFAYLL